MEIAQIVVVPVHLRSRRRTYVSGVQIDQLLIERKLALHHLPVGFRFGRPNRSGESGPARRQSDSRLEESTAARSHGNPPQGSMSIDSIRFLVEQVPDLPSGRRLASLNRIDT